MKSKLIVLMVWLLFCNCVLASANSNSTKAVKLGVDAFNIVLGDGYSADNKMSMGETALNLDQLPVIYSNIQNNIYMSNTISRDDLAEDLNVDISASGGWGIYSGSASANYMRHIASTEYSDNFTYAEQYYKTARLDISGLPHSPDALTQSARDEYNKYGIQAFSNLYGDSFVQSLPLGAILAINIQINFSSSTDKSSFNAAISGGMGSIFSASASMQSAVSQSHAKGSVEVSAYQIGGDPSRLANIFNQKDDGGYYIANCTLDDLTACSHALEGIFAYSKDDFSKQISEDAPLDHFVVAGQPETTNYAAEFNLQPAPPLPPDVLKAQDQLTDMYWQVSDDKNFVDHILGTAIMQKYITLTAKQELEAAQQALNWNLGLFDRYNAISCYISAKQSNCPAIVQDIQEGSKPVDEDLLQVFREAYQYKDVDSTALVKYVPIGGDQYVGGLSLNTPVYQATVKLLNDGQTLSFDARTSSNYRFFCNLTKIDDDVYEGWCPDNQGHKYYLIFDRVTNPI